MKLKKTSNCTGVPTPSRKMGGKLPPPPPRERVGVRVAIALTIVTLLLITSIALAQSGGGTTLSWWTVDNGSETSNGGAYAVSGTLGQPDAGSLLSGGLFSVQGGFWPLNDTAVNPPPATFPAGYDIYLPLIVME